MVYIGQLEANAGRLIGRHGRWLFEAGPETSTHHLATHQRLISTHADSAWIGVWIGCVIGIDINDLYDKIGITSGRRNPQIDVDRACYGDVRILHVGNIREHVRATRREALIFDHVLWIALR